jgi:hypothetical protein
MGYDDYRFLAGLKAARASLFGNDAVVIHRLMAKVSKNINKSDRLCIFH